MMVVKVLAEGKGIIARWCPCLPTRQVKEAGVQSYEPTCLRATHRQADRNSISGETISGCSLAKKKISIHMSCGWLVVESAFLRLEHR
jgi:hypothetical protein